MKVYHFIYLKSYTVSDWTKAREWCTKAANQNNVAANYNLGYIYLYGKGVEVNYQLAFQHYQTAADQGFRIARTQLADMYRRGLGTIKDFGKAIQICSNIPNKRRVYMDCSWRNISFSRYSISRFFKGH
jgi:TPR repeat protein